MRTKQLTPGQRRLVVEIASRISARLEVDFTDAAEPEGPNIGLQLRERGMSVAMEVPMTALEFGADDPVSRDALRVRLKVRRDRMLFKAQPAPLPKRMMTTPAPSFGRPFGRPSGGRR